MIDDKCLEVAEKDGISPEEVRKYSSEIIDSFSKHIKTKDQRQFFDDAVREHIATKYDEMIGLLIEEVFAKKEFNAELTDSIKCLCIDLICHDTPLTPRKTGVVIAGFGESESFPHICTHEIFGIVCNRPVISRLEGQTQLDNSCHWAR